MIASPPLVHHNLIASAITIAACTDASSKPSKQLCIFYSHHRPQMLDISPLILQHNSNNNRKKWIMCSFCFYHCLLSITVCRGSSSWWSPGNIPEFQMQEADKASSLACTLEYYWKSFREPRNMTNV